MASAVSSGFAYVLWPLPQLLMITSLPRSKGNVDPSNSTNTTTATKSQCQSESPAPHESGCSTAPLNEQKKLVATPILLGFYDNAVLACLSTRDFLFACLFVFAPEYFFGYTYPALSGEAATFSWDWVSKIWLRWFFLTVFVCGLWDWILYFSPWKQALKQYKMNKIYPPFGQIRRDFGLSILSTVTATLVEAPMCHLYATGTFRFQRDMTDTPWQNLFFVVFLTQIRSPHSYAWHRLIHPWRWQTLRKLRLPDPGGFLYRKVHSVHHKSNNPTAFTGTGMHPVESWLFYSTAINAVFFGLHPAFALAFMLNNCLASWTGHDGFQWPGGGDVFHLLHHAHFDYNYGTPYVPLDWLFGTFISGGERGKSCSEVSPHFGMIAEASPIMQDGDEDTGGCAVRSEVLGGETDRDSGVKRRREGSSGE